MRRLKSTLQACPEYWIHTPFPMAKCLANHVLQETFSSFLYYSFQPLLAPARFLAAISQRTLDFSGPWASLSPPTSFALVLLGFMKTNSAIERKNQRGRKHIKNPQTNQQQKNPKKHPNNQATKKPHNPKKTHPNQNPLQTSRYVLPLCSYISYLSPNWT